MFSVSCLIKKFAWYIKNDKCGAVTVEFIVLTAAVVLITVATTTALQQNIDTKVSTITL